jgi:hypothetical protein
MIKKALFASVVIASALLFSPSFESVSANQSVPRQYEPSVTCDQGVPGISVVLGEHSYRLTKEVLSPENVENSIRKLYGPDYRLATWSDIKKELQDVQARANFIAKLGIPPQDHNYDCGNILIAPGSGHSDQRYHFMAYHHGNRPSDWTIIDEIGSADLHLGRWNHYGRALIVTGFGPKKTADELMLEARKASDQNKSIGDAFDEAITAYITLEYCPEGDTPVFEQQLHNAFNEYVRLSGKREDLASHEIAANYEYKKVKLTAQHGNSFENFCASHGAL